MQEERKGQRRSNPGRMNRNNTGYGRRNSFLTMDKGIQARKQRNEMNRVTECKDEAKKEVVAKAAVGSIWRYKYNNGYFIIVSNNQHVNLSSGRLTETKEYQFAAHCEQIFCVTIERDRDE